ncbi:MAG: hypothetical protein MJ237_03040 [bacterium]|nr:hypothetical protein [bacterium]
MVAEVKAIALLTPVIASNAVFAPRRFEKGVDAIDNGDACYGIMNLDLAAGQTVKGIKATELELAKSVPSAADSIEKLSNSVHSAAGKSKLFGGLCKVVDFTLNNINPIIYLTSFIKFLFSDDKRTTAAEEICGILTMRGFEEFINYYLGISKMKKDPVTKKYVSVAREAGYHKNPFAEKQINAIKDFCETKQLFGKISLKSAPGIAKGLLFAAGSIAGYKLGSWGGHKLFLNDNPA